MTFADRHGLRDGDGQRRAAEVVRRVGAEGVGVVRLVWADLHGITRGKTVVAADVGRALGDGVNMTTTMLLKDTAHRTAWSVFSAGGGYGAAEMRGAADFVLLPDPATFRVLPWAPHTGWMLCDAFFTDGRPVALSARHQLRRALDRGEAAGFGFVTGVELEFHLFRLVDPRLAPEDAGQPGTPPEVALLTQGYNYLTESRYDALDPILERLREAVQGLGLPLRTMEVEYGPSQVEFTFDARGAMEAADDVILFRGAVKQVARRHGHHATFMCRPRIPNVMSSGWHLHQSLTRDGRNAFVGDGELLSDTARHYLGGLLHHARAAAAFSTPTLNGYRRYRPMSLAPDRAVWGVDNRGVMVRALGRPGDAATRLENRLGEPAANPYLYMASQLHFGLDGIANARDPGPPSETPYDADAEPLPRTLGEALAALDASTTARAAFGDEVVDWFLRIKRHEIARFEAEVSEWEQREYFDVF